MKTDRSNVRLFTVAVTLCQLGLILRTHAQIPENCIGHETYRAPENSDITVVCGTEHMDLSILLCPMYYARYNESLMFLNNQYRKECLGNADWTVEPPVLRFRLPLNQSAMESCRGSFKIINEVGTGDFADFSNVEYVNISGTVATLDPTSGMITYKPQVLYKYSCLYPMHYLLGNSQLGVSGVSLVIRDNNGSFVSTLSMHLYKDEQYQEELIIPKTGLDPMTRIYVAVKATNLTNRFNVLLDRCYATTSPYDTPGPYHDLFVGCTRDQQTKVDINGVSQVAHFSFAAFRFVEHKNRTVSIFFLHCTTRLCEVSTCSRLMPTCDSLPRRGKREAQSVSGMATVISSAIRVNKPGTGATDRLPPTDTPSHYQTEETPSRHQAEETPSHYHAEKNRYTQPSTFDGTSSLICYSIPAVVVIVYNVFLTIYFSV